MYHSYVTGIDESIYSLEHQGFEINRDGGNFMVSFPRGKAMILCQDLVQIKMRSSAC